MLGERPFDELFGFQATSRPIFDSLPPLSPSCALSDTLTTPTSSSEREDPEPASAAKRKKRKASTTDAPVLEDKAERRKRQNREAARSSRERKKNLLDSLSAQVDQLEQQNQQLHDTVKSQQEQINMLLARLEHQSGAAPSNVLIAPTTPQPPQAFLQQPSRDVQPAKVQPFSQQSSSWPSMNHAAHNTISVNPEPAVFSLIPQLVMLMVVCVLRNVVLLGVAVMLVSSFTLMAPSNSLPSRVSQHLTTIPFSTLLRNPASLATPFSKLPTLNSTSTSSSNKLLLNPTLSRWTLLQSFLSLMPLLCLLLFNQRSRGPDLKPCVRSVLGKVLAC